MSSLPDGGAGRPAGWFVGEPGRINGMTSGSGSLCGAAAAGCEAVAAPSAAPPPPPPPDDDEEEGSGTGAMSNGFARRRALGSLTRFGSRLLFTRFKLEYVSVPATVAYHIRSLYYFYTAL